MKNQIRPQWKEMCYVFLIKRVLKSIALKFSESLIFKQFIKILFFKRFIWSIYQCSEVLVLQRHLMEFVSEHNHLIMPGSSDHCSNRFDANLLVL